MGRACRTERRGMHIGYWWGKPERKRPLRRPRRRWVDNIKMEFRDRIGWCELD
jgi:hypothetical protein